AEVREYLLYSTLLLRDIVIAIEEEPASTQLKYDTGQTLWESSIILGKWIARHPSVIQDKE
ncbi:unnamed protein product, partial [Heterosigma akashiwo]